MLIQHVSDTAASGFFHLIRMVKVAVIRKAVTSSTCWLTAAGDSFTMNPPNTWWAGRSIKKTGKKISLHKKMRLTLFHFIVCIKHNRRKPSLHRTNLMERDVKLISNKTVKKKFCLCFKNLITRCRTGGRLVWFDWHQILSLCYITSQPTHSVQHQLISLSKDWFSLVLDIEWRKDKVKENKNSCFRFQCHHCCYKREMSQRDLPG